MEKRANQSVLARGAQDDARNDWKSSDDPATVAAVDVVSSPVRGHLDWSQVSLVLQKINGINPVFLVENALIGGGAAWFYRSELEQHPDLLFPSPVFTREEELLWLSKDVDFIGQKIPEMAQQLGLQLEGSPPHCELDGVWIDSPEVALTFGPEAVDDAIEGHLESGNVSFLVLDPITLFREKCALHTQFKNREHDALHLRVLRQVLRRQLCNQLAQMQNLPEGRQWRKDAIALKSIALDFFKEPVFAGRLHEIANGLAPSFCRPAIDWVRHHVEIVQTKS